MLQTHQSTRRASSGFEGILIKGLKGLSEFLTRCRTSQICACDSPPGRPKACFLNVFNNNNNKRRLENKRLRGTSTSEQQILDRLYVNCEHEDPRTYAFCLLKFDNIELKGIVILQWLLFYQAVNVTNLISINSIALLLPVHGAQVTDQYCLRPALFITPKGHKTFIQLDCIVMPSPSLSSSGAVKKSRWAFYVFPWSDVFISSHIGNQTRRSSFNGQQASQQVIIIIIIIIICFFIILLLLLLKMKRLE